MKTYNHYINDEWVEPSSGAYLDSENPFTGEIWARVARGNAEDADLAVKAAKEAFENSDWADMRPTQRGKLLVGLAEIIEREAVRLEEIFGPVLSVIPFEDEDEAIAIGNDIVFGLAAGVWTSDIGRALRMSEKLKAGTIWVNTYRAVSFMSPFGGYKRSGKGRESGQESIKEFLQVKSVWIAQQTTPANPFIMR